MRINEQAHPSEVIVRQMLGAPSSGLSEVGIDTDFLVGDQTEKWRFDEENGRVLTKGGEPAIDRRTPVAARDYQGLSVHRRALFRQPRSRRTTLAY